MATLLAFHAHPDDEVLLNSGTLARAASEGHRVLLVVATDGHMGATTDSGAARRLDELRVSTAALGVARTFHLGYADSGEGALLYPDPPDRMRFLRAETEEAAERLAALLREESVDLLLSYDPHGGYGHRDHVKVHEVGKRAAELAGTPRVLESTMPREAICRILRVAQRLKLPLRYDEEALRTKLSPASAITYRVNVRPYARQKRASLAAHVSQRANTGRIAPVFRFLLRLPTPLFGAVLGREWFVDPAAGGMKGDLFDHL